MSSCLVKKGDMVVPLDEKNSVWGKGVVTEPCFLTGPTAHLVFWFSHKREITIEEIILEEQFEIIPAENLPEENKK